jgi:predicted nucleic acid-binding protein
LYLLDTNIISELRRPRPSRVVVEWFSRVEMDTVFLSVVTIGELQLGVEKMRDQDHVRAAAIETWVGFVSESYNILPMNVPVFRQWARLMHRRPRELVADAMIAATAIVHNLTVVTRNLRDFEPFSVPTLNPFGTPDRA